MTTWDVQSRNALVSAEDDEGRVLYLGPDPAGNLLEVVSVASAKWGTRS